MFGSVKRLIIDTISMLLTPTEMHQIGIMPSSENNAELLVSLNPHPVGQDRLLSTLRHSAAVRRGQGAPGLSRPPRSVST